MEALAMARALKLCGLLDRAHLTEREQEEAGIFARRRMDGLRSQPRFLLVTVLLTVALAAPVLAARIYLDFSYTVQAPQTGNWRCDWYGYITTSNPNHVPTGDVRLNRWDGTTFALFNTTFINQPNWTYGIKNSGAYLPLGTWDFNSSVVIRDSSNNGAYVTTVYSSVVTF
jgi:hypothetical protein